MFGPKFYQLQFDTESSASVSVVELAGERYKSKNMVKLEETQADSAGHGRQVTFADEEKSNDDVVGAEEEHPIIKTKSMESGAMTMIVQTTRRVMMRLSRRSSGVELLSHLRHRNFTL